jgi:hypothetical protein
MVPISTKFTYSREKKVYIIQIQFNAETVVKELISRAFKALLDTNPSHVH